MKNTLNIFKIIFLFLNFIFLSSKNSFAITLTEYNDYKNASITIGKWLSKTTAENDFLSATPVAPKRAGIKFMIAEAPPTQYASDYGYSIMRSPLDSNVKAAYNTIGVASSELPKYLEVNRFHLAFGFGEKHSYSATYLTNTDMTLTGQGIGYKYMLYKYGPFYFSFRTQYSRSKRDNFFTQQTFANDFSVSMYLLFIDVYGGVRHNSGIINFASSSPELALPDIKYISKANEVEYFYGVAVALSTKLRLTFQANKVGEDYSIAAKLSMHFNSFVPNFDGWSRDPRYLKR